MFGELFRQADTEQMGVVTGEVAVKFFERTKLPPQVLGEVRIRATHPYKQSDIALDDR